MFVLNIGLAGGPALGGDVSGIRSAKSGCERAAAAGRFAGSFGELEFPSG